MSLVAMSRNDGGPYRVMIVDADPLTRVAISSLINPVEDFVVSYATANHRQAIEHVLRDPPDLVFIDLVVPWLTGLDLAKNMLDKVRDLSVFVMSHHDYGELINHILELNITGFISKPVNPAEIITILTSHKKRRPPRPSPQIELLRSLIVSRDFKSFSSQARFIASNLIMETSHNPSLLNNRLFNFHRSIIGERGGELSDVLGLPDLLPLTDVDLLSVVSVVELCIFYVLDQAFKRAALKRNPRLRKIFVHIDSHIGAPLGLKDLVEKCFISQGHLSRTFKKNFNISVMEYIHLKKIALAKAYFLFTEKTVSEVAELTGYNERSYFGKVFKKFEKSTIQQFRQLMVRADTQAAMAMSSSNETLLKYFGGLAES
ncbi:MAG: response regulator [Deltaproteobacteria bacterium]|jgi:two-component system response regulator YesN|nr:response regulator [Deltaproteobacteria bacterium]